MIGPIEDQERWKKYRIRYEYIRRMNEFRPIMIKIVELFNFHTYVELGIRGGYTFNSIAPLVKKAVAVELKGRNLRGVYKEKNAMHLALSTDQAAEVWKEFGGDPIDFLFIDADHTYEQAKKDFNNWSKFLSPCGIIALHDTYPPSKKLNTYCTVWKLAREIHRSDEYKDWEIFTFPGTWVGLSLVRRATNHLHWKDDNTETIKDERLTTTTSESITFTIGEEKK